jgi:hypothetical protein
MTDFYDQEMGGKRPKGWGDSGAAATEGSIPVQTKASFAHLREYESCVTAAHIKDEKAVSQKVRSAWPARLTPVSYVVPDADTGLVLALFTITIPITEGKRRLPFPSAGDAVCLIFPKKAHT